MHVELYPLPQSKGAPIHGLAQSPPSIQQPMTGIFIYVSKAPQDQRSLPEQRLSDGKVHSAIDSHRLDLHGLLGSKKSMEKECLNSGIPFSEVCKRLRGWTLRACTWMMDESNNSKYVADEDSSKVSFWQVWLSTFFFTMTGV